MSDNVFIFIDDCAFIPKCHRTVWNDWIAQSNVRHANFYFASNFNLKSSAKWSVSSTVSRKLLFRWMMLLQCQQQSATGIYLDACGWAQKPINPSEVEDFSRQTTVLRTEISDWNSEPLIMIPAKAWSLVDSPQRILEANTFKSFTQAYDYLEKAWSQFLDSSKIEHGNNLCSYVPMLSYSSRPWYTHSSQLSSDWGDFIRKLISKGLYNEKKLCDEIWQGSVRPSLRYSVTRGEEDRSLLDADQTFIPPEILLSIAEVKRFKSFTVMFRNILLRLENSIRTKGAQRTVAGYLFKTVKRAINKIRGWACHGVNFIGRLMFQKKE